MKIATSAAAIGNAAALASHAVLKVEAKRFLALAATQICADDSGIVMVMNNLSFMTSGACGGQVIEPGKVAVDAEALDKVVGTLKGADVTIETDGAVALVKSGKARAFRLPTVPIGECPADLKLDAEIGHIKMSRLAASRLFAQPHFAVADQKGGRGYLAGHFLHHCADGSIKSVATNGVMAAMYSAPADGVLTQDRTLIIPTAAVELIKSILGNRNKKLDGDIVLRRSRTLFALEAADVRFVSRLIDSGGGFPLYEATIGATVAGITVERSALRDALTRAQAVAGNRRLDLTWSDGELRLAVAGISEDVVAGTVAQSGGSGIDAPKLLDIIEALHGTSVTLSSCGPKDTLHIRTDDTGFLAVLAPRYS